MLMLILHGINANQCECGSCSVSGRQDLQTCTEAVIGWIYVVAELYYCFDFIIARSRTSFVAPLLIHKIMDLLVYYRSGLGSMTSPRL